MWLPFWISSPLLWIAPPQPMSYKITPESKLMQNEVQMESPFIMVIDLLFSCLSLSLSLPQHRHPNIRSRTEDEVVKCSGHVPFYLNIYWPFNGKYTWGAASPFSSLNKTSLNEIVKAGFSKWGPSIDDERDGAMNWNWYSVIWSIESIDDDDKGRTMLFRISNDESSLFIYWFKRGWEKSFSRWRIDLYRSPSRVSKRSTHAIELFNTCQLGDPRKSIGNLASLSAGCEVEFRE